MSPAIVFFILGVSSVLGQKKPVVKIGTCPIMPINCPLMKPKPQCKKDVDCPGKQKCCNVCGVMTCVEPTSVRPGRCPLAECPVGIVKPRKPECQHDGDCPKNKKCCNLCGTKICVDPIQADVPLKENPGQCPTEVDYPLCKGVIKNDCEKDSDCKGTLKCCKYKCKNQCVLPLDDKKNSCLAFDASICSKMKPSVLHDECHNDNQCPGTNRCCCADCVRKCSPTIPVNPGKCPSINIKCPRVIPKPQCQNDGKCPLNTKCCDNCGIKCVDPIPDHPGFCPAGSKQASCSTPLDKPLCQGDADCGPKQKCCLSNNQVQCVASLKEKSGQCPVPSTRCSYPLPPQCKGDVDCPGDQKCCNPLCQQVCTDPIIVKDGECPAPATACTKPPPPPLCTSDADCPGAKKCCVPLCRQECMDPIIVKDGHCPPTIASCVKNPPPAKCKSDSDCPGAKKCCAPLCLKECTDPIIAKPGNCPMVKAPALCEKPQRSPSCVKDQDCPENQKCCTNGCLLQCTNPV